MQDDLIFKDLNDEQTEAVKVMNNAVVAAGAGSGKTRVLARRYAYLVVEKNLKVDQILTLTFTKKATNEMYERIYQTLRGIAAGGNDNAREAVENFGDARIYTIDAFCSQLVKACANEYGVRPDFTIDAPAVKKLASTLALSFVLSHKDNEVFDYLNRKMNLKEIASEVFAKTFYIYSTVCNPINFTEQLEKQKAIILSEWKKKADKLYIILENLRDNLSSVNRSLNVSDNAKEILTKIDEEDFVEVQIPFADKAKIKNYITLLNYLLLIKKPGKAWERVEEYRENVVTLKEEIIPAIKNILNFVLNYEMQKKLIPLLEEFQKEFNKQKRIQGLMTFKDVSQMAVKVLAEKKEIRQLEKRRIKAIMIDEFQDDNLEQKEMLFYLAEKIENYRTDGVPKADELEKDKLFFVGDEKQSIYRFRGADVSVFKKLSEELKNEKQVTLSRNYRSEPQLIAAFNSIFGGESYPPEKNAAAVSQNNNAAVFDKASADLADYEALYKNAKTKPEDENCKNWKHLVHLAFSEKADDDPEDVLEPQEIEAAFVAKKIKEIIDEGKYKPGDICILFKKYNDQYLYEKYLRYYRLPYLTQTFVGIFGDGPANDLFSFLKICCLPQDLKAYATVLASPFINLRSSTIEKVISKYQGKVFDEDTEDMLQGSELLRYQKGKELYEIYSKKFREQSLAKTITNLWYDLGYRYETLWNNTVYRFSELYDLMYEMACKADKDGQGLFELVENAESYKGLSEKLGEVDVTTEHEDAISIMSVHKSKGLEFPVVFVSALKQGSKNETEENVFYSDEYGLSINLPKSPYLEDEDVKNYFFAKLKNENKNKECAELKRLLYVAFTRAEKELYVTSVKWTKYSGSMLDVLQPVINYYLNSGLEEKNWPFDLEIIPPYSRSDFDFEKKVETDKIAKADEIEKKFNSIEILSKEIVPGSHFTPSHLHQADDDDAGFVDTSITKEKMSDELYNKIDEIIFETMDEELQKPAFTFANFGTIAHAVMEAAILNTEPVISNRDVKYLSKKQEECVLEICSTFAKMFLETELGKKALSASWKKTEYAFKSKISRMILTGSIDLVFEDDDANMIVVDYKTNKEIKPEIYYSQLAAYRNAIAQMRDLPLEKVKCYLYYLRYSKAVDITDECKNVDLEDVLKNAENL